MIKKFKIFEQFQNHLDVDPYGEENWDNEKIDINIIVPKISEDRKDSFWYWNKIIAEIRRGDTIIQIYACGDVGVRFEKDGPVYNDQKAVDKALELNLIDTDLFDSSNLNWLYNNWFELIINGDVSEDVIYGYDEAINEAMNIIANL